MSSVRIVEAPFDPDAELTAFRAAHAGAGAMVSFIGQVRPEADMLELQHYDGVTEAAIQERVDAAGERWRLAGALVVHRVGRIFLREAIVLVAAAAEHRREAFEAVDFMMDYLKSEAPFWKKEWIGGVGRWVEPRAEDYADAIRWRRAAE